MNLSKLVAFLNHVRQFRSDNSRHAIEQNLEVITNVIEQHELQFQDIPQRLKQCTTEIHDSIDRFDQLIDELMSNLKTNIEAEEPLYLQESYRLYNQYMRNDSNQVMLDRRLNLGKEAEDHLRSRINRHSDWHYPGMILRPGLEDWIHGLVALDPLYLVDVNMEMMASCQSLFNPDYQKRLRYYTIQESTDSQMLQRLPRNQMAFVLAYNYFNYKPLELIRCFLTELYDIMRPGGTLAFTFNDCDKDGGVKLSERYFMCYTPGRLLLSAAEMIGFQIAHTYDIDSAITWAELVKPGDLHNLRGGQSLAKIVVKNKVVQ